MAYPDLIATPAYQEAMRARPMMERDPASRWAAREPTMLHSYQLRDAGARLDHLIRNALDPNRNPNWPPLYLCSALKAFLEVIEATLPRMRFDEPAKAHAYIEPRLELAREIIARADKALVESGHDVISSAGFRQVVVKHEAQNDFRFEDIVFENPLCDIARDRGPFGPSRTQDRFHTDMMVYWD
jgi:hypothetical protein